MQGQFSIQLIVFTIFFTISVKSFSQGYFQQEVNYTITVSLNDRKHELNAFETIEYTNNSPDTLRFLFFHLWPNAYKNESTAYAKQNMESGNTKFYFSSPESRGYIDSLNFKVDNLSVQWEIDSTNIDICKLMLNKPLLPNTKITITTPFHVKIPSNFSRLGHLGTSYQITQWYPKPAVYDSNGWNQMPYLDQGEFYSEFGNFDVSITIPRNYVVAATGNLQDEKEKNWLLKKVEETSRITDFKYFQDKHIKSDSITKTIRFSQNNVHDFAWFADKNYLVQKSTVTLPNTGKIVDTWSFYAPNMAEIWKNSTQYINDALYYYSRWNGDYPYDNCTAVMCLIGTGGGMEYPTITAIGYTGDTTSLEQVIMHEVGHNWFYGILGSNERNHPWMDEGINSFYEMRYTYTKYPKINLLDKIISMTNYKFENTKKFPSYYLNYLVYLATARTHYDQPGDISSEKYWTINYGTIVYYKNAYIFNYLMNYLGEETFDGIMKTYYEKWKFKHPQPEDLKQIFKENCEQNLDWFFNSLLHSTEKIDYKIVSLKKGLDPLSFTGDCWDVTIKNNGTIAAPFPISAIQEDSIISTEWIEGFTGTKTIKVHFIDFDKLIIDANYIMPDFHRKNNTIKKQGLLKKAEPFSLKFLTGFEDPEKTQLFYLPVTGWNNYNKTMIGVLFYNNLFPAQNFDYQIMPMYSFVKNNLAGSGKINYTFYTQGNIIHDVNLSFSAMQYAWEHNAGENFQRYKSEADLTFQTNPRSSIDMHLICNSIIASDIIYNKNKMNYFENISYTFQNKRSINPFGFAINSQLGNNFAKCSFDANYKITYNTVKKGLFIRLFAGKFIYNYTNKAIYNFRISGAQGYEDYTFDQVFPGRTEYIQSDTNSVFAHQFIKNDGGFTIFSPWGQSNDWLLAINLYTSIPSPLPLRVYANFASFPKIETFASNKYLTWETGIEFNIIPEILSVYFPIAMANELKSTNEIYTSKYIQKVRFTLNLNKLNLFNYVNKKPDTSWLF